MRLHEKNCEDKADIALAYEDWQPLLALIPKIENRAISDKLSMSAEEAVSLDELELQFIKVVYASPIIIDFDWGAWDEGRKIAQDDHFDFDTIDLLKKCKLITAIVRNDRFCEGALMSAFESGLILKILKSIENEVSVRK